MKTENISLDDTKRRNRCLIGSLAVMWCLAGLAEAIATPVLNVPAVDNSTYRGKTMFGYQGWFSHPDAPAPGNFWRHWGDLSTTNIEALTVDMYPDLREYGEDELFDTAYTLPNGDPAPVFSSVHPRTVERHMKWVRDYNIDGVFQQRFLSDIDGAHGRSVCDQVAINTKAGCDKFGRVFAMMYDGSGWSNAADDVKNDWIHLVDEVGILGDSYLHHDGRPLVALWGFTRRGTTTPEALSGLIDWFHFKAPEKYRASVKLGVFNGFDKDADYAGALKKAEVISPWYVGLTETRAEYEELCETSIAPAKKWCDEQGILFVPVIYPGFSWYNLRNGGNPQNRTPRDGGKYYWMQSHLNLELGAEAMYIAMLDEVDECTAMFKTSENASMSPVEGFWLDLDADGYTLPSDWYLRCAGKTAAIVRGDLPNSPELGTPDEGIMTLYPLDGGIRFIFPDFPGQTTLEISLDGGATWPYSTPDDAGEFVVRSLPAGAVEVYVRHPGLDAVPMGEVLVPAPRPEDLSDVPNPLMGTNNDGPKYSRGNQYPAITVPFGMTAWAPVTGDPGNGWFFDFDDTRINAIKATHQPSPWAKDYGSFEIMAMTGELKADPEGRASSFNRDHEICEAYHYKAKLEDHDTVFEVAPTLRCASFNITYPETDQAWLLFANQEGEGHALVNAVEQKVTGRVLNGRTNPGYIYFCATFDKPFVRSGTDQGLAYVQFKTAADETVNMKIGTSWISEEQAEVNLKQEIGSDHFETVKAKARAIWNEALNRITVEGGSDDEKTVFYSCLYRGLTFPKAMWEEVDSIAKYYSPYDGKIHQGKLWAGNGFWDTFRAVWPFFTIMYQEQTGEMLDGWVNSYKDGGWTVKWSNPGYWDCMIGTHTDSLFADAYLKGIRNFDVETAYEASVKNATVPGAGGKGRVGLESYLELGYVAADQTKYSAARTLEFSYSDFCVAQFAKALRKTEDYERFSKQAMNYQNIFSPEVGFFRGKNADGTWRTKDADFKPNSWGHEWIEGCAWHYIAAPMHDGEGLARLYGGRKGLEQKVDDLFAVSPDFDTGSYGKVIHEIQEAYDIGMKYGFGQYAHGNQPAQHLIYMYNYAGRPSKTQYWARKAMKDLYTSGLTDGYGYCGDEDNGQTSLWYVFSALGMYPASPGFPEYCIGSPLFDRVTLHLENGKDFVISAAGNSDDNIYIQQASLNGRPSTQNYLKHSDIMAGGQLDLLMGNQASSWGTGSNDVPSSVSARVEVKTETGHEPDGATE